MNTGQDIFAKFAADGQFHLSIGSIADVLARLPPQWESASAVLVQRTEVNGAIDSIFRLGPPGNWRRLHFATNSTGRITDLSVDPDPDNR
jgi:hypothetical protein